MRFDLRYRALTGVSPEALALEIERGFPTLPAGCHVELDRVASSLVLDNVRSSLRINWAGLVEELRRLGDVDLGTFLAETGLEPEDLYRRARGGWADLRRLAGFDNRPPSRDDQQLTRATGRLLHLDDLERLEFLAEVLSTSDPPGAHGGPRRQRLLAMLHFSLWGWNKPLAALEAGLERLWTSPGRREELIELVRALRGRLRRVTTPVAPVGDVPLHVHAHYSLVELLASFGVGNPAASRGAGVRWIPEARADVFWFNLRKTERHFSPTTMYADRAISPSLIQRESQNATSEASPTGQRFVHTASRALPCTCSSVSPRRVTGPGSTGVPLRRPGRLREPHRRAADARHLEAGPRAADGCVRRDPGRGRIVRRFGPRAAYPQ